MNPKLFIVKKPNPSPAPSLSIAVATPVTVKMAARDGTALFNAGLWSHAVATPVLFAWDGTKWIEPTPLD